MPKKSRATPHHRLSIYLLKEAITAEGAVKIDKRLTQVTVALGDIEGTLYVQPATTKKPAWAKLFRGVVDVDGLGIRSSTAAAVLLVPARSGSSQSHSDTAETSCALEFGKSASG